MADTPYTRAEWNDIIQRVNDLSENPDDGCDPLPPLEEVPPDHRWAKSDIRQVHERLQEICPENEFEEINDLWKQSTIDEIEAALEEGWCECDEECHAQSTIFVINQFTLTCTATGVSPVGCGTTPGCGGSGQECFDWYAAATSMTGFGTGIGGAFSMSRVMIDTNNRVIGNKTLYGNSFDCSGNQVLPLPRRPTSTNGDLLDSCYSSPNYCVQCTEQTTCCFLWFCSPCKCHIGLGYCFGEQLASAQQTLEFYQAICAESYPIEVIFRVNKIAPTPFHDGFPCRECAPNGIDFVR